ncbi:MAG: cytochrome b/b6 domain-containing protein [Sphingomonadaceae bacterium]
MKHRMQLQRRWDPIVKLTHWGVLLAVLANAILTEEGSGWHIWVGYGLAALLAVRFLWGVIGPSEARFSAFPPSPAKALAHLGEIRRGEVVRHRSHNPLGALMAYAIWATLLVIVCTGIAMAGPPPANPASVRGEAGEYGEGMALSSASLVDLIAPPARADEDEREDEGEAAGAGRESGEGGEEVFEEIHEIAVNLLYILIALHLIGVIFETRRSGSEIVRAMIPGGTRQT